MAPSAQSKEALKKWEDMDVGAIAVSTVTSVVKNRPVSVSLWVMGLLLAYFANGFAVDEVTVESYQATLQMAEDVSHKELQEAYANHQKYEQKHYELKGWFWQCDARCQKALDRLNMAKAEVARVEGKKASIIKEARQEVGIWSTFGVKDVRDSFWRSWKSGKDMASRMTMMDAFMMAMPGSREESIVSVILKLVLQYVVNLTMGLIFSLAFFIYNTYCLVVAYGESFMSGLAFFLLVVVASAATVGTYLGAIYGTVVGGGVYLVKQAAKQAALEGENRQRRPQMQNNPYGRAGANPYGRPAGPGGGFNRHYE